MRSVYGYSFLIYFNFSGYTDLVTGISMIWGVLVTVPPAAPRLDFTLAAQNLDYSNGKLISNQGLTLRIDQALASVKGLISAQTLRPPQRQPG